MKIKKKNTTIPISGKIVDTENVEDKISNAPSMRLFEEKIQDLTIEQANDFVVANNGYTVEDSNIFKQGKHYFGYVIIKKTTGYFDNLGQTQVATLKEGTINVVNSGCFISNTIWSTDAVGYLYIVNKNVIVSDKSNSNKYNYAKINIDVVVS